MPSVKRWLMRTVKLQSASLADKSYVMNAKVVGFLMINFHEYRRLLGNARVECIALGIVSPGKHPSEVVYQVGRLYYECLLGAFRSSKGPIPRPYDYSSRRVFDTQDLVSSCLDMYANDYETAKEQASVRDGFRCMVSKYFNASSFYHSPHLKRTVLVSKMSEASAEDNNLYDPAQRQRGQHATSVLTILNSLGIAGLVSKFYACGTTHDLSNVLTLRCELYQKFDGLEF
ncbi:uncharacterized protein PHACADRAFT_32948 [Phanerochaete carnosa HHB-10118-sp]|uniref:HNH nuclease domain-containing protein n=1 Tax=Phanerochaete carnosa (strain HHB-10118-sp) TaxID=650164 RepID=K5WIN3_PHACS|nr:uncharacterized protein PHACADRAFT_32948 [Phanerochaete carnosa HHB-10118-sp]EKM50107.1 hypothetical protein PHACADRAFT_32948 [Phanerochaete carnosa HHB-10118-sp]